VILDSEGSERTSAMAVSTGEKALANAVFLG
jgi:hypothetical protein